VHEESRLIVVVDYGLGNLGSFANMFKRLGVPAQVTRDRVQIEAADKLVLPGVGSFEHGIEQLRSLDLFDLIDHQVRVKQTPILGVCLGAQLMTRGSREGAMPGFGWIEADTVAFDLAKAGANVKVPHMGWSDIEVCKDSPLFHNMHPEPRFYFVHSYHFECDDSEDVLTTSVYGYPFTSAFERGNVMGVQFHPEKSHRFGMKLLGNFASS